MKDNPNIPQQNPMPRKANDLFRGYTGTELYHQHLPGFTFTDGVKALCDKCESYWLIDFIVSYQMKQQLKSEAFQKWEMKKMGEGRFRIHATDGNKKVLLIKAVQSDFPCDEVEIWMDNQIMLLPSEY